MRKDLFAFFACLTLLLLCLAAVRTIAYVSDSSSPSPTVSAAPAPQSADAFSAAAAAPSPSPSPSPAAGGWNWPLPHTSIVTFSSVPAFEPTVWERQTVPCLLFSGEPGEAVSLCAPGRLLFQTPDSIVVLHGEYTVVYEGILPLFSEETLSAGTLGASGRLRLTVLCQNQPVDPTPFFS